MAPVRGSVSPVVIPVRHFGGGRIGSGGSGSGRLLPNRHGGAVRPFGIAPATEQGAKRVLVRRFDRQDARTGILAGDEQRRARSAWLSAPRGDMLQGNRQSLHVGSVALSPCGCGVVDSRIERQPSYCGYSLALSASGIKTFLAGTFLFSASISSMPS